MMGLDSASSFNQGNHYNNGFADPEKENNTTQLNHFKSMMQTGLDRSTGGGAPPGMNELTPNNLHPGQISPTTLNMFHAGGHFSSQSSSQGPSQGNAAHANGGGDVTREQLAGMYGGDQFGQQLGALQSSHTFAGPNNPSSFAGQFGGGEGAGGGPFRGNVEQQQMSLNDQQQAYFQSFATGQATNFPPVSSGGDGAGGAYGNPTLDDMAQLFGMSGSAPQHSSAGNPGNNNGGNDTFG